MTGTVGAAAQRQGWSKIASRTTVEKFLNQCCGFEHATVIDRQPVESLWHGCDICMFSMIYERQTSEQRVAIVQMTADQCIYSKNDHFMSKVLLN